MKKVWVKGLTSATHFEAACLAAAMDTQPSFPSHNRHADEVKVAETKTPLDAPAPPGAALNAGGQVPAGANANTTSDSADMKAIYQSTLVYYKRNNPVLTRRRFVSLSNIAGCLILCRVRLKKIIVSDIAGTCHRRAESFSDHSARRPSESPPS